MRARIVASLLLFPACVPITAEAPPVADTTLVQVLVEIHLAAARAEVSRDLSLGQRDSLLRAHGLDRTRFEEAMRYYSQHPEDYLHLYDEVIRRLEQPPLSPP
jgi:hypothetical protein